MSRYAIGDIQGCFEALQRLLAALHFKADCDQLWLCGDLVNRGPQSLATLRFVHQHREQIKMVLGNHDLHLLAMLCSGQPARRSDTLADVLQAPDRMQLAEYLLAQPLAQYDEATDTLMTHAGLPPCWNVPQALTESAHVQQQLQQDAAGFFAHMYGNEPALWRENLTHTERCRFTVNALTRMRYLDAHGGLDLQHKNKPGTQPATLRPWFEMTNVHAPARVIFGHWAALHGQTNSERFIGLDTGCVWGKQLTAIDLDSGERHCVTGLSSGVSGVG